MIKGENIKNRDNAVINDDLAKEASTVRSEGDSERTGSHGSSSARHHGHYSHHTHHSRHHSSNGKKRKKSKRRSSRDKNNGSLIRFIKRNKLHLIYAASALIVVGCLVFVATHLDYKDSEGYPSGSDGSGINVTDDLNISVPLFSEDVTIVGPAVEAYMSAESTVSAVDIYKLYSSGEARLDVGLPVTLSYKINGAPEGYVVKSVKFVVADNAQLSDPYTANVSGYVAEVDFYNLKTGTKYYYSVEIAFENGVETTVSGSFKTASGPRLMNVSGVNNMRDIGGWVTVDGRVIKQGLLYRGCEIDGAVEPGYAITPEGIETMLTVLGIKTDMDLRRPEDNEYGTDVLGPGVEHTYYSAPMYANVLKQENAEKMREIFSDLADESNYPIYMHCTYGQDRTGTVCYILEALLGLGEEELMKEYQLSALFHGYQPIDEMTNFVEKFKSLPGETMSEKAEGYLLSIGVTAEQIASIRQIHLSE